MSARDRDMTRIEAWVYAAGACAMLVLIFAAAFDHLTR